jgi:hypothetical protein
MKCLHVLFIDKEMLNAVLSKNPSTDRHFVYTIKKV